MYFITSWQPEPGELPPAVEAPELVAVTEEGTPPPRGSGSDEDGSVLAETPPRMPFDSLAEESPAGLASAFIEAEITELLQEMKQVDARASVSLSEVGTVPCNMLFTYQLASPCLLACLRARVRACVRACLLACLLACVLACAKLQVGAC